MKELQKSWKQAMNAIEEAQKNIKRQFDKKRRNPQGLKVGNNCYGMLWTLTFFFFFYLFFLILYFFLFLFSFSFSDDEEAHDIAVT